jgi:hypothetical protein
MSKRRSVGDVVRKKANAGYVGEELVVRIVDLENNIKHPPYSWCMCDCGDNKCKEWTNVEALRDGKVIGYCYHVSECQMEDL